MNKWLLLFFRPVGCDIGERGNMGNRVKVCGMKDGE